MKKILSFLFVALGLIALVSCTGGDGSSVTVERLQISGQTTEFTIGDQFEVGELVVSAFFSDGSQSDVTDKVTVSEPANLNAAGTYAIFVTYEGLTAAYQINVKAAPVEPLPEYENIEAAILAAKENAGKVKSGVVTHDRMRRVTTETYEFGANHFERHDEYESHYYSVNNDGEVYGVYAYEGWNGPAVDPVEGLTEENLLGLSLGSIMNDYDNLVIGAEGLVAYLYELASGEHSQHFWENINVCANCGLQTSFEFGYEILVSDYYFYDLAVEFVLDCKDQAITSVVLQMDGYYYDDLMGYEDEEWVYHYELDEEGNYVLIEDATPKFTYDVTIEQELGERTAENPYPYEKCYYQGFELEDAEGNAVTEETVIEAGIGESVNLSVVNALPEDVISGVDEFVVSAIDSYGFESFNVYGGEDAGIISLTAYAADDYVITISTMNVSCSFKLKVKNADLESFEVTTVDQYGEAGYEAVETITAYAGVSVSFTALVNEGANDEFTAALSEANDNVTLESYGDYYSFSCSVLGSYEVILTSAENAEFTATLTIEVVEAPDVSEILNGTYVFENMWIGNATYVFVPSEEGSTSGVLTITEESGSYTFNYSYEYGWLSLIPATDADMDCVFGAELNENFILLATYNGWAQGELVRA